MPPRTDLQIDDLTVSTLKGLAIDAIQAANSGHPGMPMGMAAAAHVLWSRFLKFDPSAPAWPDRDRFVLSAGHGSMLLYGLLHLYGFPLSMDDLRQFRQLHSRTPGHPEFGHTAGVDTTTGPLGQGLTNAVGMALAEARLRAEFGAELCDHWTWVIAGDGCMMEGITHEASSLAGHLGLGRLIVLYDSNHISIDGRTELTFTEDVAARYRAYGWIVSEVAGDDQAAVAAALQTAQADQTRPKLIVCHTTIGAGSPKLAGSHKVHGAPLGPDEVAATKRQIGLDPEQYFHVEERVYHAARARNGDRQTARQAWEARLHRPRPSSWTQALTLSRARSHPGPKKAKAIQGHQDQSAVVRQDRRPKPGQAHQGGEEEKPLEPHRQGHVLADHEIGRAHV